jgi:hypothetical protein
MIITLNTSDKLVVHFAEVNGEFEIHFDTSEYPKQLVVRETAGFPGNRVGAASSLLYHEDWRSPVILLDKEAEVSIADNAHNAQLEQLLRDHDEDQRVDIQLLTLLRTRIEDGWGDRTAADREAHQRIAEKVPDASVDAVISNWKTMVRAFTQITSEDGDTGFDGVLAKHVRLYIQAEANKMPEAKIKWEREGRNRLEGKYGHELAARVWARLVVCLAATQPTEDEPDAEESDVAQDGDNS